jgi:hypothetical protein
MWTNEALAVAGSLRLRGHRLLERHRIHALVVQVVYGSEPWQDTSIQALRTESAKQLAQAITTTDARGWWMSFALSYHELRASTRAQQGLKP